MLRWALAIRPGSKWLESKVEPLSSRNPFPQSGEGKLGGFRLKIWNRLPEAKPAVKVTAKEAGLTADADVLQVQLNGAAYRLPAEFEVAVAGDKITLKVSQSSKLRLDYGILRPDWAAKDKPILRRRHPGGGANIVRDEVVWKDGVVEWLATAGEYDVVMGGK
jgi:hypothetical protein